MHHVGNCSLHITSACPLTRRRDAAPNNWVQSKIKSDALSFNFTLTPIIDVKFDWILGSKPDPRWEGIFEQTLIQGTKYIWEVAFFHKQSKTLILVDLLENIGDNYKHKAGLLLQFWWKVVFRMWNNPKAAPEYQMGWGDKDIVKIGLNKILSWDAERVILAHGENIENNINTVLRTAWEKVLNG